MRIALVSLLCWAGVANAQSVSVHALNGDRAGRTRQELVSRLREAGLSAQADDGSSSVVVEGALTRRHLRLQVTAEGGRSTSIGTSGRSATQMVRGAAARLTSWLGHESPTASNESESVEDSSLPGSPYDGDEEPVAPRRQQTSTRSHRTSTIAPSSGVWQDAPRTIEIAVGLGLMSRRFDFTDDVRSHLTGYQIVPAPQARASVAWFPLRMVSHELWANIGVVGRAEGVFLLDSSQRQGQNTTYATRSYAASFGLRYELPFDRHLAALTTSYGEELFALDQGALPPGGDARPTAISVHYRYLRPALSASFRLFDFLRVGADAGWRFLLSTGGLDRSAGFPGSNGSGFDAEISVAVRVAWFLEVQLRGEYHRYFFSFQPTLTDWYAVGGAMDEWTSIGLDAVLLIPGASQ